MQVKMEDSPATTLDQNLPVFQPGTAPVTSNSGAYFEVETVGSHPTLSNGHHVGSLAPVSEDYLHTLQPNRGRQPSPATKRECSETFTPVVRFRVDRSSSPDKATNEVEQDVQRFRDRKYVVQPPAGTYVGVPLDSLSNKPIVSHEIP